MRLRYKVTSAFLLFIVGPFLIVGWFSANRTADSMMNEVGKTNLQLVSQNHVTMEKTLMSINDKMLTLLDNDFFSNPEQYQFWTNVETVGQISEADKILERWSSGGTNYTIYMKNSNDIETPFDLSAKNRGYKHFGDSLAELPDSMKEALEERRGGGLLRLVEQNDGSTTVSLIRTITNPSSFEDTVGLLAVSNMEVLLNRDLMSVQMPADAGIFLLNRQQEMIMNAGSAELTMGELIRDPSSPNAGYYFANQADGRWLYAYSYRPAFSTLLVYKIPFESIQGNQTAFQWIMIAMSAIYLALVLAFVLYLIRMIVKPLSSLVHMTKIYEPGKPTNLENRELLRNDEFGLLYGAFVRMTKRLDHSIEENYGMMIKQKEIELATLHSQITPHLLYNTLDSIYWFAIDSGNDDVGEMVSDLSMLLRIGLSKGRMIITIAEEIEHVQAYCRLQMRRYQNAFQVTYDIDDSLRSNVTPKVILQPLVENAIFHGVSGMDGEGVIGISVHRVDDTVVMTVEDNGFLQVDMVRLDEIVKGERIDKGYGIRNVHQRIALHYGDKYGLHYERIESGGIRAVIRLPLE